MNDRSLTVNKIFQTCFLISIKSSYLPYIIKDKTLQLEARLCLQLKCSCHCHYHNMFYSRLHIFFYVTSPLTDYTKRQKLREITSLLIDFIILLIIWGLGQPILVMTMPFITVFGYMMISMVYESYFDILFHIIY